MWVNIQEKRDYNQEKRDYKQVRADHTGHMRVKTAWEVTWGHMVQRCSHMQVQARLK